MQSQHNWDDYLYFLKVAERGSLKAASTDLGVNNSTVFRRINGLEEKLKVRLFERLKTGYQLTESGREIIERVRQVEKQMHAINRTLLGKDRELSGTIRISTTDTIGYYWLPTYIKQFREHFPDITIDVNIENRFTNLSANEADIVIPAVNLHPEYMVGRKIAPLRIQLCASHGYLEKHGKPRNTEELCYHRFVVPNITLERLPAFKWLQDHLSGKHIVCSSNKLTGLYRLARQGLGITMLPHYVINSDPELIHIMDLPEKYQMNIWILTHPDLRNTARISAFMQFMYREAT